MIGCVYWFCHLFLLTDTPPNPFTFCSSYVFLHCRASCCVFGLRLQPEVAAAAIPHLFISIISKTTKKNYKCLVAAVPDGTKENNASCCAHLEFYSHMQSKIRFDGIYLGFRSFRGTASPVLDKPIRWSIPVKNLAIFVGHPPRFENPCHFLLRLKAFSKWASYFQVLKVPFWKADTLAPASRDQTWGGRVLTNWADLFSQKSCVFEELQESRLTLFRYLHYHHNINVWGGEKKTEECRLLTFRFVLSSITVEQFFFPSTLVEGIKKKKEHRHAYLISFFTGSHKRNCQDTFRKVSIKSKLGVWWWGVGGFREWF